MMNFSKYHGCGNDFVIIKYNEGDNYSSLAIKLCNRNIAIGADGLIVVKENPLEMLFYNADGSRAPMCGNGIRCFARYAYMHHLVDKKNFDVLTLAGIMKIEIISDDPNNFLVKVNMGKPIFSNEAIKALDNKSFADREIIIDNEKYIINSLFMGTIHTVMFVDDLKKVINSDLGEKICNHELFKEKTNVNFVKMINDETFIIRTYERGVGFTYACGTGACASYVIAHKKSLCKDHVKACLTYGELYIEGLDNIYMTGPATKVFESEMEE